MITITAAVLDPTRLIVAAPTGLVILLPLTTRFKVRTMIFIPVGVVAIDLIADIPFEDIIGSINEGIGSTFKEIALLVGLGSIFDLILEMSGGIQTLAVIMMKKFGDKKATQALGITGLVTAMSVFFDVGLIILTPLAFSLAKRTRRSSLLYAIPLLAGLTVGHVFIPPIPGPVLVATMLGVDLGWVIMVDIVCGILATIVVGPIRGIICGDKYDIPIPGHIANQEDFDESKLPKFGAIVGTILIPLILIILNSTAEVMFALASVQSMLGFLGGSLVALTIATVVTVALLGYRHGYSNEELEKVLTKPLEPTELILLVTACDDVLQSTLQNPGLGDVIGNAVSSAPPPIVAVAFVVAALVRIPVDSTIVAMTMAAGIIAAMPEIVTMSPLYLACTTTIVTGGTAVCSHFNGSGLWPVKSLVGPDGETTLKAQATMETLMGDTGFVVALIISFFVQGWLDSGTTYVNLDMTKRLSIN